MRIFAVSLRQMLLGTVPILISLSALSSCGGRANDVGDGDTDPGTGSSSATTGNNGSGGRVGSGSGGMTSGAGGAGSGGFAGGGSSSGGSTMTSSGGAASGACVEPIDVGPCDAAIPRYGFDQAQGHCVAFSYGGCMGNANNFTSLDACVDACGGDDGAHLTYCTSSADCTLTPAVCCSSCGTASASDYQAINNLFLAQVKENLDCSTALCPECVSQQPDHLGVFCENSQCKIFDANQFTQCDSDEDCHIRGGLSCCGCGYPWLAISDSAGLDDLVCDYGSLCGACAPPPEDLFPTCLQGSCRAVGIQ